MFFGSFSSFSSRPNFELLKILTILDDRSPGSQTGHWPKCLYWWRGEDQCQILFFPAENSIILSCISNVLRQYSTCESTKDRKELRNNQENYVVHNTYFISHSISRWFSNSSFLANNCCCKFWTKGSYRVSNGKLTNSIKL